MPTRRLMHVNEIEYLRRAEVESCALAATTPSRWWSPFAWLRVYAARDRHAHGAKLLNDVLTGHKSEHKEAT